jgi:ribosomal protein S18 acetylase RimI-like enzyme
MQTSLWDLRVPEWVQEKEERSEISYRPFTAETAYPLLEFAREHFPGDWVRVVRETSLAILGGESPRRLWTAVRTSPEGDQVVGFAHYDRERFGPIGVSPEARGQGIGQVLTLKVLRSQQEAGLRASWFLWSDDKTAARLYDNFGFKETRRFALLRKNL